MAGQTATGLYQVGQLRALPLHRFEYLRRSARAADQKFCPAGTLPGNAEEFHGDTHESIILWPAMLFYQDQSTTI